MITQMTGDQGAREGTGPSMRELRQRHRRGKGGIGLAEQAQTVADWTRPPRAWGHIRRMDSALNGRVG